MGFVGFLQFFEVGNIMFFSGEISPAIVRKTTSPLVKESRTDLTSRSPTTISATTMVTKTPMPIQTDSDFIRPHTTDLEDPCYCRFSFSLCYLVYFSLLYLVLQGVKKPWLNLMISFLLLALMQVCLVWSQTKQTWPPDVDLSFGTLIWL